MVSVACEGVCGGDKAAYFGQVDFDGVSSERVRVVLLTLM